MQTRPLHGVNRLATIWHATKPHGSSPTGSSGIWIYIDMFDADDTMLTNSGRTYSMQSKALQM